MAERSFGPVVVRRRLGSELRRLRDRAGLSLEQVARELEVSPSKISRLETGQSPAKVWDVRNLLTLYGVEDDDYRRRAERWVREARAEGWWHPFSDSVPGDLDYYISLESEAAEVLVFCNPFLYGLLQTEAYARALILGLLPGLPSSEVDGLVNVRMERKKALEEPQALRLDILIDESVLLRRVGDASVMREQYESLLMVQPQVETRVLPLSSGPHLALQSQFTIFVPRERGIDPEVVNLESAFHDSYWEDVGEVERFRRAFETMKTAALDPDESRTFIRELARKLT